MNGSISRQEAIEALDIEGLNRGIVNALQNIISDPQIIPSVDVSPAQQWIHVKYRPMTEEERGYWLDRFWYDGECELVYNMTFDCQMPDDEQKILVCSKCGNIWIDTHEDDGGLMCLEKNGDWKDIVAWMPLPEPYKEVKND